MFRFALLSAVLLTGCRAVERTAVRVLDGDYEASSVEGPDTIDADHPRIEVGFIPVANGLEQATDIQFAPGDSTHAVVLTKPGVAYTVDIAAGTVTEWFRVDVVTVSEQGLLGLAFHPDFATNGRFFINHTPSGVSPEVTRISEYQAADVHTSPTLIQHVLQVEQPYQNHNAGQLQFGPDKMLYIGMGDGGLKDDPFGNGQDRSTLLGNILRVDVDAAVEPYGIPADNPFVGEANVQPEIWAYGLRNPWRFSFAPDGRLVVADVGQDTWEELSVASSGDNLGWNNREGLVCFPVVDSQDCEHDGSVSPFHVYDHDAGVSITGGYVYTGRSISDLTGKYVFADFVTGRMWAMDLPDDTGTPGELHRLGSTGMLISTFGVDASGRMYVADYGTGRLWMFGLPITTVPLSEQPAEATP